jgi:hypothetical protein
MLSLISTVLGLLTSGLPKLLEFFQAKADQKHEMALARIQNEKELAMAAQGFAAQAKIEEIRTEQVAMQTQAQMAQAEAEMTKGAQDHDKAIMAKASTWVVNFNGLVRPSVTFIFVLELVGINVFLCFYLWNNAGLITDFESLMKYVDVIFSEDEMAMLGAIIGFWFGSRGWSAKK